jgi:hypothetical protein
MSVNIRFLAMKLPFTASEFSALLFVRSSSPLFGGLNSYDQPQARRITLDFLLEVDTMNKDNVWR